MVEVFILLLLRKRCPVSHVRQLVVIVRLRKQGVLQVHQPVEERLNAPFDAVQVVGHAIEDFSSFKVSETKFDILNPSLD